MQDKVDICIVGGGVVGLLTALECAESGKTVRLIDKNFTAASRNNIGELTPQEYPSEARDMATYSEKRWQEISQKYESDLGIEQLGAVYMAKTEAQAKFLQQMIDRDKEQEVPSQFIEDRASLMAALEVNDLPDSVRCARLTEGEYAITTETAMNSARQLAIAKGVRIWGDDEVTEFIVEEGKVVGVSTRTEECRAESVVICAGVWSAKLLDSLNLNIPMRPSRCHLIEVSPANRIPRRLVIYPTTTGDTMMKTLPSGRGLIMYNGLNDQAQATWSTKQDMHAVQAIIHAMAGLFKGLQHAPVRQVRVVSIAVTPDMKPYIGGVEKYPGLYVAVGFNGKSYAYAAGVAHSLCALMAGEQPEVALSPFSPDRFADGRVRAGALPDEEDENETRQDASAAEDAPPAQEESAESTAEGGQAVEDLMDEAQEESPLKEQT